MKNWKRMFIVCAAAMTLALGCHSVAFAAGEISVTGTGVVMTKPDTATLWLSAEAEGKTAETAQRESNKIIQKVTNAMLNMGIREDKIVTTNTSVYPVYQYTDSGKRDITKYHSYATIRVTTTDIDNAGKYVDAALKAGATNIDGVSFSLEDKSPYYTQALEAAVKSAESSAAAIAAAYGKPLGEVKSITENTRNVYYTEAEEEPIVMADMAMDLDGAAKSARGTDIRYSDVRISADISVVYNF